MFHAGPQGQAALHRLWGGVCKTEGPRSCVCRAGEKLLRAVLIERWVLRSVLHRQAGGGKKGVL